MSRILDSYIAEHVMELPTQEQSDGNPNNLNAGHQIQIKKYSTDMNAAMEVLNSENIGIHFNITSDETYNGMQYYIVTIGVYLAAHNSLPTAICLAALKAVGRGDLVDE